jgi:lysophospholipase L1-like esterase
MKRAFSIALLLSGFITALQKQNAIITHKSSGLPQDTSSLSVADINKLNPVLENIKSRMDDWPQLHFYKNDNERIAHQSMKSDVVFLGDSIFEYWTNPALSNYLISHKNYVNRGISAQTTPQMLLRFRSDVLALKPKVMILLAGINDIGANTGPITLEETEGNIASIVELAQLHNIKVVLCSVLPVSDYHFDGKDPRGPQTLKRPLDKIRALNRWIKQYAQNHNLIFVDYFNALVDDNGKLSCKLSNDDLHPNKEGYALMESLTEEAIKTAIK